MPTPENLPAPRHFVKDALSAVAFTVLAFALGKAAWRSLGPFGGVFFVAICGGLGYLFARSAFRTLNARRKR